MNHPVHSPRYGPEHFSLSQVAQIPIQEQSMYTSSEPQFNMKTGCFSQDGFNEVVFMLSFSTEITQELSLYSEYYPTTLSAKSHA